MHIKSALSLQMLRTLVSLSVVVTSLWMCGNQPAIAQEQSCENSYKASPIWSPEAELIAFGWVCDGQSDIWLIQKEKIFQQMFLLSSFNPPIKY